MKKHLAIFITGVMLLSGCTNSQTKPTDMANQSADVNGEVYIMAGKVEGTAEANISSKISAKALDVFVQIGSVVKKGDSLVKFDANDISAQVKMADANVEAAVAGLSKTQGGTSEQQITGASTAMEKSKIALQDARSTYERQKQDSSEKVKCELAKKTYDRQNELFNSGAISKADLDSAQTGLKVAQDAYNAAIDSAKVKLDSATQQYQLDLNNLQIITEKINPQSNNMANAQLKQAIAARDVATVLMQNGVLLAPIDGAVTAVNIKQGEFAMPGVAIITIVDSSGLSVKAYLPSNMISQIKEGQGVTVRVSELDKKADGVITMINPAVDAKTKTVMVKVSISGADSNIKPGMFAEISIKN